MEKKSNIKIDLYQTFPTQIEILPRLSIIYGFGETIEVKTEDGDTEIIRNGIAIEWLWFAVFIHRVRAISITK